MKTGCLLMVCALCAGSLVAAVPSLKGSAEVAGTSGLKVKALASSQAVPAATPQAQHYRWTRGGESGEVTHYVPRELWLQDAWGCQWKDRKGNLLTVATVKAACPDLGAHAAREDIEKALADGAADYKEPTDEALAAWATQFLGRTVDAAALKPFATSGVLAARLLDAGEDSARCVAFFQSKDGQWRFVEFKFVQEAKAKDAERLLKSFLASVTVEKAKPAAAAAGGVVTEGKWATVKIPGYVFKTDLPASQRGAFLKDATKMMAAMQAAYRRYVPPQRELKESTIRAFATREGYNQYMKSAVGEDGSRTIGLWNPSLEELLIITEGKSPAERKKTMKTMRHEAFHQYLFYATGNGRHAMWFNEGHACFFETVMYSPKTDSVRFVEDVKDRRAGAVTANPQKYAALLKTILPLDHDAFYAGSLGVVNDKYTAAWALVYFLAKGAPALEDFAKYRAVLPTYLKEAAAGKSAREATEIAFAGLEDGLAEDFLKFWNKRARARNYEPPAVAEGNGETSAAAAK